MTGGMKSKEFFEIMDKNGDGKISKMEFRQAMRDLGLMGESSGYNAKDVDSVRPQPLQPPPAAPSCHMRH
jgi:hypothetical protein